MHIYTIGGFFLSDETAPPEHFTCFKGGQRAMSSVLPVYYQIKQTIRNWIINREFHPGEKIPSENELASQFNVSRLTVRQAISQLVQEGFLNSKRGEGTFVTNDGGLINSFSLEFSGFMDDLFYQVSKVKAKYVEIQKMKVSRLVKEKLELEDEETEVVRIKRVRLLREKPFAYTINYLPLEIGTRITEKELYKSPLLKILERKLGIHFTEAFQIMEASFANQEVAEHLGISPGSPILYLERIMYTTRKRPVEFVQSCHRGDIYKYVLRLKNVTRREGSGWALRM
jgi:GntR family transcriptional regulator